MRIKIKKDFVNMNNKYNKIIINLENAIRSKELGKMLENKFYQYIEMLKDNIFSEEEKYKLVIMAENDLANVRDFPNKVSNIADNKGKIR